MGSTIHLWTAFVGPVIIRQLLTTALNRLQRALHGLIPANLTAHRSIKAGVSGRYSVIPPVGIPVLQINFQAPFNLVEF